MKNSKKMFIVVEVILGITILVLAVLMFREKSRENFCKVSVIVRDSDNSQWSAFRYGLKMAAEDAGVSVFVVSTGDILNLEEEMEYVNQEIENGADAVIMQPLPGAEGEELLKRAEKKVPVMFVEHGLSLEGDTDLIPVTKPDNYAMGKALGEELLKDYSGNISGKTVGILGDIDEMESTRSRREGLLEALAGTNASICWSAFGSFKKNQENSLEKQPRVDIVIALDDSSLKTAGECGRANNLHGALVYGIGNSTESAYYLDIGIVKCLVVPDEFSVGYESLTEVAGNIGQWHGKMKDRMVSYRVIRREELFSKENQDILFTMSQ